MHVQISYARLRDWNEPKFVCFLAEISRYQRIHHVVLNVCGEALPDDGGRYVPTPETRKPSHFLIFLNQRLGLAGYFLRSEEHTSELQSLRHLVCRLLLEKKND